MEHTKIATDTAPAQRWIETLRGEGYCIIRGLMNPALVEAVAQDLAGDFAATPLSVGPFYGGSTRRFHGLLRRSPHVEAFVAHPLILAIMDAILGPHCDRIQLNLTQGIEIEPGGEVQPPHRDQDMWPIHAPGVEYLINVMWPFTPYTAGNGGTLVWPRSHLCQDHLVLPDSDAIAAEMAPGDVLLFLGSTLHSGGANRSNAARRGMIVSYSLGWLKPYELPWLAYPPEVARGFSQEVAALAGYRAHRPNLGTFEGRCPSSLLREGAESRVGAVDSLRPEQESLIEAWRQGDLILDAAHHG